MPLVDSRQLEQMYSNRPARVIEGTDKVLFRRAKSLAPKDQVLLEMAFKNNLSLRQIGRILDRPAGTISRKVHRLCARLRDPLVVALLEPDCLLAPQYRRIAIEFFAQGKRLEELSQLHGLSKNQMRNILNFVRGWHRGIHMSRIQPAEQV